MSVTIIIEEHVVPQIMTSAIEAFEIKHRTHSKGKAKVAIETYGLLWGYVIPSRHNNPSRIVCTMATIETSALKHEDWVKPDEESIEMKRDFISKYWPQLELVGTFHSHPYEDLSEVNNLKGWRATLGDEEHWSELHELFAPELPNMAHLIITITSLKKEGWALPQPLAGGEASAGFVLSSNNRKLWIRAYSTEMDLDEEEGEESIASYSTHSNVALEMPSIIGRFLK